MGEAPLTNGRSNATIFLAHFGIFLFVVLAASWLRRIALEPDAILQGYLQVISGLLAFVFAVITLVRFQGTQDRISLILGAGFLLSGAVLTATSVLFFQFFPDSPPRLLWAPIAWWLGRMVLALLLVVALLVERFLPRSLNPRACSTLPSFSPRLSWSWAISSRWVARFLITRGSSNRSIIWLSAIRSPALPTTAGFSMSLKTRRSAPIAPAGPSPCCYSTSMA